jgi:Rod binding domain-containing protein
MEISSLNTHEVRAADLPLDKLAANQSISEKDKIAEVSRQFESVLLRQILAQAQKPLFDAPLAGSGSSSAIYQDMITQELADRISRGGSFGFANVLEKQLSHQLISKKAEDPALEATAQAGNKL